MRTLGSSGTVRMQSHHGNQPLALCLVEASVRMQPRVFLISAGDEVRETISVVARTLGFQCIITPTLEAASAIVDRERPSAALLDLPGTVADLDRVHRDLRQLLVSFLGRVIVITDERPAPEISAWIGRYCIPSVQRDRLAAELWPRLETMIYPQLGVRRIAHTARLIFDTCAHRSPTGIRGSGPGTRQLVYETTTWTADLLIERLPDSPQTKITGQILRTADPPVPLGDVPVVLKGPKGPMDLTLTNSSGEFSFESQNDRGFTIEIEASPNEVIVITPPVLA